MDNSGFGFASKFSNNILSDQKYGDQLLSDVEDEEEYDALNDETFGIGADDGDWEEDHDKFAELIKEQSSSVSHSSIFDISGLDGDDSQHEIVSQSISQLGLEDDLDDPAIMTIGRSRNSWPAPHIRLSPPPPAIIDPELCGSPKTHSIWSTNNKSTPHQESGIGSLFSSISNSCSTPYQHQSTLSPVPNNVFSTPQSTKTWTLEELERDLTSLKTCSSFSSPASNQVEQNNLQSAFVQVHQVNMPEKHLFQDVLEQCATPKTVPGMRTLDDIETDMLKNPTSTVENVERAMISKVQHDSDSKRTFVTVPAVENPFKPVVWPMLNSNGRSGFVRPLGPMPGIRSPGIFPTFPPPVIAPDKSNNFAGGFRPNFKPLHVFPPAINSLPTGAFGKAHLPQNKQMFYPTSVLNQQNMKGLVFGPGRVLRHPLLGTPMPDYNWPLITQNRFSFDGNRAMASGSFDEYAGFMTQSEKEWLLRVQLSAVQSNNPYTEDFYYSTLLTRKCAQEACKNKPDTDGPKLLLLEKSKTASKTYVPAQFEGSLGKLQAVSVNFPKKVLDITVSRPLEDEEGNLITNQNVSKNRRLLMNIEKLYNFLLEIDDEEKRILALPENAHGVHLENIEKLRAKLAAGLGCEAMNSGDTFQNIMGVRKGRSLGMRSFVVFSKDQKLHFLISLCRCLSHILRKDQNDLILLKNLSPITDYVKELSLPELVLLGENLENLPRTDTVIVPNPVREKSNFINAFKYKFGSTLVCEVLQQADDCYKNVSLDSEDQGRWANVVLHIVNILCTLPESVIVPPISPYNLLLAHFQRFDVDKDKFAILEKKLKFLKSDCFAPNIS